MAITKHVDNISGNIRPVCSCEWKILNIYDSPTCQLTTPCSSPQHIATDILSFTADAYHDHDSTFVMTLEMYSKGVANPPPCTSTISVDSLSGSKVYKMISRRVEAQEVPNSIEDCFIYKHEIKWSQEEWFNLSVRDRNSVVNPSNHSISMDSMIYFDYDL